MSNLQAVLARLSISQFSNTRGDESITAGVKVLHKLTGKAGKWTKYKLDEAYLSDVKRVASATRQSHYDLTLPWVDGSRLLTLAARPKHEEAMTLAREAWGKAVDAFFVKYPEAIESAKVMHNGTFNPTDYPPEEQCRAQFGIVLEISPVPQTAHFGGLFTGEDMERMRAQLESTNATRVQAAVEDTIRRLLEPVAHMATVLADRQATFRNSLVTNVKEICALIPALNVTGNAQLADATRSIEATLATISPDDLRDSVVIRQQVANAAGDIVRRFGAMGTRKLV